MNSYSGEHVCPYCFENEDLKVYISEKGEKRYCDFCEEAREKCLAAPELQEKFDPRPVSPGECFLYPD